MQTRRRTVLAGAGTAIGVFLAGCTGDGTDEWETEETLEDSGDGLSPVTQYHDPSCSCCGAYADYLDDHLETDLEVVHVDDIREPKSRLHVPRDLYSCHTIDIGGYVVEGHVPVSVIGELLDSQPAIAGIALPEMPSGSPGMGGEKGGEWTVYGFDDSGDISTFTVV